jgi:hypothetical protein
VNSVRYNSRQRMTHNLQRLRMLAGIALCTLVFTGVGFASSFGAAAVQFARDIADATGPGTVHIEFRNASLLSASQFQEFTNELQNAMRARGVRLVTANTAAAEVRVTASENVRGNLFVAEIRQGNDVRTPMLLVPRVSSSSVSTGPASPTVVLRRSLVVEQDQPVLDVAVVDAGGSAPKLVVLGAKRITVMTRDGAQWRAAESFELQHARPWPIDVRGRLVAAADHPFEAYLPGTVCSVMALSPVAVLCRAADDAWPIAPNQAAFYNASRNYFSGLMVPAIGSQQMLEPFFSAAPLRRTNYTLWVLNGVDGRVRLTDGSNTVAANGPAVRDWGSDIAVIGGACGIDALVLATGAHDGVVADTLRAYEIRDREPLAVSGVLDVPGAITALWPQPDGKSVIAAVQDSATGDSKVYSVTATCNQ